MATGEHDITMLLASHDLFALHPVSMVEDSMESSTPITYTEIPAPPCPLR